MNNKVIINGKAIRLPKGNIEIVGDKIIVNGQPFECDELSAKTINITITGRNVGSVSDVSSVVVNGNVQEVHTINGSVEVSGHIKGNAQTTNGNIRAEIIHGVASSVNGNIQGATKKE